MPGKNKPMMGHKPKAMSEKQKAQKAELAAKVKPFDKVTTEDFKALMDMRAKMAMPKMVDSSNFPKMAQDMASALIPKMDHAKMYKPTKYHDGPNMAHGDKPMMGHKPKMYGGDKKN